MDLFDKIQETDRKSMLKCINAYARQYTRGDYIRYPLEADSLIGIIEEGSLQMAAEDLWGNRSLISILQRGAVFGETFACARKENYVLSYQALSDCRILFMDYSRVFHTCSLACSFHHRMIENIVKIIAEKNLEFIKKVDVVSNLHLREKILTYLSQCARSSGTATFTVPLGRLKMAEYLCVDRSALSRELSNMSRDGLISYEGNRFTLHIPDQV